MDGTFHVTEQSLLWLINVAWMVVGVLGALRPTALIPRYGTFGVDREGLARVSHDDQRIARIGASACGLAGLSGAVLNADPSITTAIAVTILCWTAAIAPATRASLGTETAAATTVGARAVGNASFLNRLVVITGVLPLIVAALAVISLRTTSSVTAGVASMLIAVAVCLSGSPSVSAHEQRGDLAQDLLQRYRFSRAAAVLIFSPLPLTIWFVTSVFTTRVDDITPYVAGIWAVANLPVMAQSIMLFVVLGRYRGGLSRPPQAPDSVI